MSYVFTFLPRLSFENKYIEGTQYISKTVLYPPTSLHRQTACVKSSLILQATLNTVIVHVYA